MAASGSVTTSSCEGRSMTLTWKVTSQSVTNNTSTIEWHLKGSGSYTGWIKCGGFYVSIGGNVVCNWSTDTRAQVYPDTEVANGSTTLSHNSDGTKSFSISVQAGIYEYARNCSGSGSFSLNTIARASKPTLSKSSAELGTSITINTNRASSSFTHTLKYKWGSLSGTIATGVGSSKSWTLPLEDFAKQISNATSGSGTITCETYNGSTKIGSNSVSFTGTVPASVIPEISSMAVEADNSASEVIAGWGLWVVGYTKAHIIATASGKYDSTISSFSVSGGVSADVTGESLDYISEAVKSSGEVTFSVTAKDSRRRSSEVVASDAVMVYPYSAPIITEFIAHRDDADATKVTVKADWDIASVNGNNSATATLQHKKANETEWATYGTISQNTEVTLSISFDESSSYNFRLTATDAIGNSAQMDSSIGTGEALLDFRTGGKGIAIGKMSEKDSLEVGLPTEFLNDVSVTDDTGALLTLAEYIKSFLSTLDAMADYVVETGTSEDWTYRKFNSGNFEAWGYFEKTTSSSSDGYEEFKITVPIAKTITSVNINSGATGMIKAGVCYVKFEDLIVDTWVNRATGSNKKCWIYAHVFGTWK